MAFRFASSFGSHMVLQQAPSQAQLWGFAPSANAVRMTVLSSSGAVFHSATATVSRFNASAFLWRVVLPAVTASSNSYTIAASQGANASASISDILFGEVWVCSGQSNMAFLVENAFGGPTLVQDANNHPAIRLFTTRKLTASSPLQELGQDTSGGRWTRGVELPWSRASNTSISDDGKRGDQDDDNWLYMSAVCYLFGKSIHTARNVPVGLINTNWGGTAIEDWMPAAAMQDCDQERAEPSGEPSGEPSSEPGRGAPPLGRSRVATHLFNGMVSPLLNHTIKGAHVRIECFERWHFGSVSVASATAPTSLPSLATAARCRVVSGRVQQRVTRCLLVPAACARSALARGLGQRFTYRAAVSVWCGAARR